MTGYELSRNYFDWSWENPDLNSTNMTALYMWFIEKWNRCGQPKKFSITAAESMNCLGMKSRNTYADTFNKLVQYGFIEIVVKSSNQYSCNVISLAQIINKHKDSTRTALDKALIQQVSKHEDSTYTINKQINNKQRNKETYTEFENSVSIEDTLNPIKTLLKEKEKVAPKRKSPAALNPEYPKCMDHWHNLHPDFIINATAGTKMKSIITKLTKLVKGKVEENTISNLFKKMCDNLPEWYQDKDLSVIDSKFNEIVAEIKKKGQPPIKKEPEFTGAIPKNI